MVQSFWSRRMGRERRPGATRVFSLAAVLVSSGLLGCGGRTGESGGTCDAITGCGGDLSGTWDITSICTRVSESAPIMTSVPDCDAVAQRALVAASFTLTDATVQFAGGTYFQAGTVEFETTYIFTDACLAAKGLGTASGDTCSFLESTLSFATKVCNPDSGTCRCKVSDTLPNRSGTFRVSASEIFFDSESGRYCVRDERAIFSASPNAAPGAETRYSLRRHVTAAAAPPTGP